MSNQSKFIAIGIVIAFGIGNAYYTLDPGLREMKEKREGTHISKTLEPQNPPSPPQPEQQKKAN